MKPYVTMPEGWYLTHSDGKLLDRIEDWTRIKPEAVEFIKMTFAEKEGDRT